MSEQKKTQIKQQQTDEYDLSNKDTLKKLILQVGDGKIGTELSCLIQSRYKILYITTNEERRVMECLKLLSLRESYRLYQWDLSAGMVDVEKGSQVTSSNSEIHKIPEAALGWIIEQSKQDESRLNNNEPREVRSYVVVMHDMHHFLRGDGIPIIERMLKQFASISSSYCIILVSPSFQCSNGLSSEVTLVDFPYPSRHEVRRSLRVILKDLEIKYKPALQYAKDHEEELLDSVSGLTLTECENAFAKSIVKLRRFDIPTILEEKRQIIKKNGILECREPRFSFDDIGGLCTLKDWLSLRKAAFTRDANDFGIQTPKGVLLIGVPGCVLGNTKIRIRKISNEGQTPIIKQ